MMCQEQYSYWIMGTVHEVESRSSDKWKLTSASLRRIHQRPSGTIVFSTNSIMACRPYSLSRWLDLAWMAEREKRERKHVRRNAKNENGTHSSHTARWCRRGHQYITRSFTRLGGTVWREKGNYVSGLHVDAPLLDRSVTISEWSRGITARVLRVLGLLDGSLGLLEDGGDRLGLGRRTCRRRLLGGSR